MPSNLALRLTTAGHVFVSKNRKVSHPWRWGRVVVGAVVLATVFVLFTSIFLAWADLQLLTQSYQISQSQETQKQYLDLNKKLRLELASLTAISRLEQLAAEYGMGAPLPSQVVKLPK
jgi:cell division protein FtsL